MTISTPKPESSVTELPASTADSFLHGRFPARGAGKAVGSDLDRMLSDASRLLDAQRQRLAKAERDHRIERATLVADIQAKLRELEAKGEAELRRLDARHREEVQGMVREIDGLTAMRDACGGL